MFLSTALAITLLISSSANQGEYLVLYNSSICERNSKKSGLSFPYSNLHDLRSHFSYVSLSLTDLNKYV